MDNNILFKTYSTGLRLVFKKVEETKPADIIISVRTGSCNETKEISGISHFIEHLNFKGTKKRDAKQINIDFENIGAMANASTSSEVTSFYATSLSEKIEETLEILSDIVLNSTYHQEDIDKERLVVFEEMAMDSDSATSSLYKKLREDFFKGTPYAQPVLGTEESLKSITRKDILEYVKSRYIPENIVVTIVGSISEKKAEELVEKYINSKFKGHIGEVSSYANSQILIPNQSFSFLKKDEEQTKIALSFPIVNRFSKEIKIYSLISIMLGGLQSSRLWQKVREDNGLVYTIYSSTSVVDIAGELYIFFATTDKNTKKALSLVKEELVKASSDGFTLEELDRAKAIIKASILTSEETSSGTSHILNSGVLYYNEIRTIENRLNELEQITLEDCNRVVKNLFNFSNICACAVSKNPDDTLFDIFK